MNTMHNPVYSGETLLKAFILPLMASSPPNSFFNFELKKRAHSPQLVGA
jgi:hypothetical protein